MHYDRTHFEHLVVSLGPRSELHEELERRDVQTFALGCTDRARYPLALGRLIRLLRRTRPDILQTHLFWPSLLGLAGAEVARVPITLVTRHHSDFTTTFHHPIHRHLDRLQARWANGVLAASCAVKRDMIRYENAPADKIAVAHYGYDFSRLRPMLTPEEKADLRTQVGGRDRTVVITVARLSPSKGHSYYLRALRGLVHDHPDLLALLVGTGPLDAELRDQVQRAGLDKHVRFLGWRSDAHRLIEAADIVVHPSLHEAFCSVIIESMALERPLIATDIAGAPEQIDHKETGILVPPRDSDAIEEAVQWMLSNRSRASALGKEGRRRVSNRFNFPKMMAVYEDIYHSILELPDHSIAGIGSVRT